MTPDEPPGIPLSVAFLAVAILGVLAVVSIVCVSLISRSFQRMQDRRLQQAPSRTEWLRVGLSLWLRSIVDSVRRGH